MRPIVYVDVLFITNALIGYFTLLATSKLCGEKPMPLRLTLGAVAAGFASCIIFVPLGNAILWIFKIGTAVLICVLSFRFTKARSLAKAVVWYLLLNFALAGTVFAMQYYFSPQGIEIHNLTLYFNVSPIVLLLSVLVVYLAVTLICLIFARPQAQLIADVTFRCGDREVNCKALVDSGFSVKDPISGQEAFMVSYSDVKHFLPADISQMLLLYLLRGVAEQSNHFRLICVHTAAGTKALPAVKATDITVKIGHKTAIFPSALAVFTNEPLAGGSFGAIIGMQFAKTCL